MKAERIYTGLSPLLRPLAAPYALLMRKRRERYAKGGPAQYRPSTPTVSIGNIAWGGSGKTPLTSYLLDWARNAGLRAVVLSRGYGASPGDSPLLVTEGTSPEKAGDEPLMLARKHPEASIVVFPKRAQSALFAETRLEPDLLILDDGMQHLAVARDCDLVLLRPEDVQEQWNRVIPGGSWREDASALRAATAFLMKISPGNLRAMTPEITRRLQKFSVPLFSFDLNVRRLLLLNNDAAFRNKLFEGSPYLLVSGVGNPAQVNETTTRYMGLAPKAHLVFPDHHAYSGKDAATILAQARCHGSGLPVLCTAKDAVKLCPLLPAFDEVPVLVLETELQFGPSLFTREDFNGWWQNWWQAQQRPKGRQK